MILSMKHHYLQVRKILDYAPVVLADRNWDECFIWMLLRLKLARCERYFRNDGITVGHIRQADQIRTCVLLLDRLIANAYWQPSFGEFSKKTYLALYYDDYMICQDMQYLFKLLMKHMRSWWD